MDELNGRVMYVCQRPSDHDLSEAESWHPLGRTPEWNRNDCLAHTARACFVPTRMIHACVMTEALYDQWFHFWAIHATRFPYVIEVTAKISAAAGDLARATILDNARVGVLLSIAIFVNHVCGIVEGVRVGRPCVYGNGRQVSAKILGLLPIEWASLRGFSDFGQHAREDLQS